MDIDGQLRNKLKEATEKNKADGILLSGGLDSSVLAFIARPSLGFTVALKNSHAADLSYSEKLSRFLRIQCMTTEFTVEEALNALPEVIGILKTFDLALPNDLSIYFALKLARENGISSVMTGDGGDELFAGYSYMTELPLKDLERYIWRLSDYWCFSGNILGEALGVEVKQPFLDEAFVRFALEISPEFKVKQGVGKYILRKSFENIIPQEIVWREKEPIECGSGSSELHGLITNMVSDEEFRLAAKEADVKFINKEHFYYYRIYSDVIGEIPRARDDEIKCPCCGAAMGMYHCRTCGFARSLL